MNQAPASPMPLDCNGRPLWLDRPQVMGVLNVTPDSFSDGGRFSGRDAALAHARAMAEAGAAVIDVGGESTRPGAAPVSEQEELDRVLPVIEALAAEIELPLSIDTSKPGVMRAAVAAGAGLINDVRALREPGALQAAAELGVPLCLMHMQGEPRSMQQAPSYGDVLAEVQAFLLERAAACQAAGVPREHILLDPGFGFGKTVEHNLSLLKHLDRLAAAGYPLLVGLSRKSLIGAVLGLPVADRLHPSVALAVIAAWQGARLIRVHDVAATVQALGMCAAVQAAD
ncbi:dihydropteroate synthase [Thiohalobacter sp. IOR34]|uniref:dihydropteroate synthase n=1 Tax=Thiohalobacter sp. IOR34 TaxID=3057176 RepID=UPI0025B244C7|nr:dihydropteroate synthase [Thiohalobacter sp. IOR34]WJW76466.1 dihydropteroate synthase [Thiohalobacter sp. IOR34]